MELLVAFCATWVTFDPQHCKPVRAKLQNEIWKMRENEKGKNLIYVSRGNYTYLAFHYCMFSTHVYE